MLHPHHANRQCQLAVHEIPSRPLARATGITPERSALGKQAPTVTDLGAADAVEDAIELYVTDMAHRRTLVADENTPDFEEARMFKHGEEISHGHFRK